MTKIRIRTLSGNKETFRVSNLGEIVPEYDYRFSRDGGSYRQARYEATVNGIKIVMEDTSCGDFGLRIDLWVGAHHAQVGRLQPEEYSELTCPDLGKLQAAIVAWQLGENDFPAWLPGWLYANRPRHRCIASLKGGKEYV